MTTGTGGDFLDALSSTRDRAGGIVSARRRQGKTYLLDAAATTLDGFFFTATDSTEADSLADLGRVLAGFGEAGSGGRYEFADWDEALRRLFGTVAEGVIVIDEFPYLMKASPALSSLIQRALGPRGYAQQSRARLLLSGSAMPVMGNLLSGSAPLRGRASLEMIIRPFGYRDAAQFWTRLERGDTAGAWRNSQAAFLSKVIGPHFEGICRDWALSAGDDVCCRAG